MEGNSRCIECGGEVEVTHPTLTDQVEECLECGRKSHWHVCSLCGEVNGPRRTICLECGVPFDRQKEGLTFAATRRINAGPMTVLHPS
jgi:ribosomal protein L32